MGDQGEKARAVVVDFLDAWRFCPVSKATASVRAPLEDAAKQLLDALDTTALHPDQSKGDQQPALSEQAQPNLLSEPFLRGLDSVLGPIYMQTDDAPCLDDYRRAVEAGLAALSEGVGSGAGDGRDLILVCRCGIWEPVDPGEEREPGLIRTEENGEQVEHLAGCPQCGSTERTVWVSVDEAPPPQAVQGEGCGGSVCSYPAGVVPDFPCPECPEFQPENDASKVAAELNLRRAGVNYANALEAREQAIRDGIEAGFSERFIGKLVGLSGPRINQLKSATHTPVPDCQPEKGGEG